MRKFLFAAMIALLPLSAFAQNQPVQPTAADSDGGGLGRTLVVTAGVVGGLVVADLLTGGAMTGSLLTSVGLRQAAPVAIARAPLSPAIQEARAAGAVLGEQILGATEARDVAARRDMLNAAVLGLGALTGGWLVSRATQ